MTSITPKTQASVSARLTPVELLSTFVSKDPVCERVGLELEKFSIDANGRSLPITGERSVTAILEALERRFGWQAEREGDTIIALRRGGVMVSVEPGGQIELSTPPAVSLDEAYCFEREHLQELAEITRGWGIRWCGAGIRPIDELEEVGWVPKRRYLIMRDYLANRGKLAHWMMKMTASLQVSVDYRNEADAARKLGVAARLVPILTALCAASPISRGEPNGFKSYRSHIWTQTDPDRCGLPECFFKTDFRFSDYVEYALSIPLFFIEREGELLRTDGLTFRQFMDRGFGAHHARLEDWSRHLTFLFPEIRLKSYIEIRCCDRQPGSASFAVAALIKAILYSPETLLEAADWLGDISVQTARVGTADAARRGFEGALMGRPLGQWAAEAVRLGRKGLDRLALSGRSSAREDVWYKELEHSVLVEKLTLADHMLAARSSDKLFEVMTLV